MDTKDVNPLEEKYVPSNKMKDDPLELKFNKKVDENDDVPSISFFSLFRYASGTDKIMIFLGIIGSFITGLTAPSNTFLFGKLADAMILKGSIEYNNSLSEEELNKMNDEFMDAIYSFSMYNCIIGVVTLLFSYLSVMFFNYAAHNQIHRIRSQFFRSALNQDISWYDLNQIGEFASRMNEDLSKLEDGLGDKVVMFAHFTFAFLGQIILAFVKGWELALVCISSLPLTMICVGIVGVLTSRLAKREMQEYGKAGSIAEEVFSAIRTVFAFGGQDKEIQRYKENLIDAKKIGIRRNILSGIGFGLLWFFIYASYGLAFWYGVGLVVEERNSTDIVYTPGVMFTIFFSVMLASMNLGLASPYIETFGIAKGAGAKVYKLIEQKPTINPLAAKGERPETAYGNIVFKNVFFQYPSRPDVKILKGLNLNIKRGETIALVGSSGCGKSTCIQLIQRFYDTISGEILFDGRNIKNLDVNWLRAKIGVVGQEPVLFGTTVYENIKYGNETATREQIEMASIAANAHNFINKLPNGYDTLVGEKGAQMSGGQKQRIAIARALVRNPEILLLDEATSALDTASEANVQVALEKASEGRTTIIVAHRLSTIRNANKIIVLSNGQVVEEGTHNELMNLKGHYYGLVTIQVGSTLLDNEINSSKTDEIIKTQDEDNVDYVKTEMTKSDTLVISQTPSIPVLKIIAINKPEYPHLIIGSFCSIIMGAALPVFAVLLGEILGVLSLPDDDYVIEKTNKYSLYFLIAGVIIGIANFLQVYTYGIAGEILTERVRCMIFSTMLKQEVGWFDDKLNGTGSLCARLSGDAAAVQGATGQRIGTILQSLSTLFLAVGLSMYYEWRLGLLTLAFTPFILIATFMFRRAMVEENLGNSKSMESSTKLGVEVVSNIRTVVSLGVEAMFHKKYMEFLESSLKISKRNTHYGGFVYGLARSLMFFAFAACMLYGGYLVLNDGLYYASVFKVSQALVMGTFSIANALAFTPNFQKGLTAAAKIFQLLERQPLVKDSKNNIRDMSWESDGNVQYNKAEFFYPTRPETKVLQELSMNILKGTTAALVGSSGCGKSTCIQLIERFYDATNGTVSIDNKNVRDVTIQQLRKQMGIVSQEPSLFDRTIQANIAYGDNTREVTKAEIIDAAKSANIHNFIISLPLGYDTRLGEKGTQLSGGQKQRVAIARALIRNPRILLLDEATSALDSESEKIVQEALDNAKMGRTCITIAHRLSTIINSDIIFVINNGTVAEKGTHKELLDLKGIYYRLYKIQAGSNT